MKRLARLLASIVLPALIGSIAAPRVAAHDPGVSAAHVRLAPHAIRVTVGLDRLDALRWLGLPETSADAFDPERLRAALTRDAGRFWAVRRDAIDAAPRLESVAIVNGDDVRVVLTYPAPRDVATNDALHLHAAFITRVARGHRHLVSVFDAAGRERSTHLLSATTASVRLDPRPDAPPPTSGTTGGFFILGVEHILIGFDHLLFLLALLLAGGGLMATVRTVTAFTVAHSITLAVAALGVWQPAGAVVEPLIALSIVLVAVENLVRRGKSLGHRWSIAFALGLVHGFGFAGVLAELGVPAGSILPSLVGFNLGVEAGQVAVVLLAYPLLAWLNRAADRSPKPRGRRSLAAHARPALSVIVALVGSYWFVERTLL